MRSSWIQVGPKYNHKCPYKFREGEETRRGGHVIIEADIRVMHTSQGTPRTGGSHQEAKGKAWNRFFQRAS